VPADPCVRCQVARRLIRGLKKIQTGRGEHPMSVENFMRFIMLIYPTVLVLAHVLGKTTRSRDSAARIPASPSAPLAPLAH
jgi:hypothetical protein